MFNNLLNQVTQLGINELWKQHGDKVQNLVVQQLLNLTEEKINQNDELSKIIDQSYSLLPANITALLPKTVVINKIIDNKAVILAQVQKIRASR